MIIKRRLHNGQLILIQSVMMVTKKILDGKGMVQQHITRTLLLQTMDIQKKVMLLLDGVKIEMQRQPLIHQVRQLHGREPINCSCMQSGKKALMK